jgi:glycosyltransferase involved in cell wall biosynthesis
MTQRAPRLSVITANYNAYPYLREAVASVQAQSFGDWEMIIVDDCSSDGSLELARDLARGDSRIITLAMPCNGGPAAARNRAIQEAQGEWLGVLDSDDVAFPGRFAEQFRRIDREPELVALATDSISINAKGETLRLHRYPNQHEKLVRNLYSGRAFPPHSSMVYKKEVVERLGGFNIRFKRSQDYDLWLRLSECGRIASVPEPLVKIRKHSSNISDSAGGKLQYQFWCAAAVCHYLRAAKHPDPSRDEGTRSWDLFWTWLTEMPALNEAFERRSVWAKVRDRYFESRSTSMLERAPRLVADLLSSNHARALLWEKAFGNSLPARLAEDWMRR